MYKEGQPRNLSREWVGVVTDQVRSEIPLFLASGGVQWQEACEPIVRCEQQRPRPTSRVKNDPAIRLYLFEWERRRNPGGEFGRRVEDALLCTRRGSHDSVFIDSANDSRVDTAVVDAIPKDLDDFGRCVYGRSRQLLLLDKEPGNLVDAASRTATPVLGSWNLSRTTSAASAWTTSFVADCHSPTRRSFRCPVAAAIASVMSRER